MMATVKPTLLSSRRTTIGNLVILEGEIQIPTTANDGFDFSEHVSRIYSFSFSTEVKSDGTRNAMFDIDTHNNGSGNAIGLPTSTLQADTNGRLIVGSDSIPIIEAETRLGDGTHTNKTVTGLYSGRDNARATIVASSGVMTSVVITTNGDFYFEGEPIQIEDGGTCVAVTTPSSESAISHSPGWWPHLIDDTTLKMISFYSDNGACGNYSTSSNDDRSLASFVLMGRR